MNNDFNGFTAGYQPLTQPQYYYQPVQTTPMYNNIQRNWQQPYSPPTSAASNYQQQNTGVNSQGSMIWVQGEAGAKAYSNLQPGVPVPLWDSEESVIYIKTIDQTGKPTMTIIDYKERDPNVTPDEVKPEYVTKDQFDSLNSQFSSINGQLNDLGGQIADIENRINNFGNKSQSNSNSNRRGNKQ